MFDPERYRKIYVSQPLINVNMILQDQTNESPETSDNFQTMGYRIASSAKAFAILSDSLYANKIPAIIRELSCNACDSHVEAGTPDLPFDLHLPTPLEPWFEIRDYGVGMDHDEIATVYTTYFESTKTARNDLIGALGLGSKSPFSYTSNFTVTSTKAGITRIYSAFLDNNRIPNLSKMAEFESPEERNGVAIKFAVTAKEDFALFAAAASDVLCHMAIRPNINPSNTPIHVKQYSLRDIIPGVHLFTKRTTPSIAIMGNVAYPIRLPQTVLDNLSDTVQYLAKVGVELNFNIGELAFQPSREGLSYIDLTITAITNKLIQLETAIKTSVFDLLQATANKWAQMTLAVDYQQLDSHLYAPVLRDYFQAHPSPILSVVNSSTSAIAARDIVIGVEKLNQVYNIDISALAVTHRNRNYFNETISCKKVNAYISRGIIQNGNVQYIPEFKFDHHLNTTQHIFIVNKDKQCCLSKLMKHFKHKGLNGPTSTTTVFVVQPHDKTKPMLFAEFFLRELHDYPSTEYDVLKYPLPPAKKVIPRKDIRVRRLHVRHTHSASQVEVAWNTYSSAVSVVTEKSQYVLLDKFETSHEFCGGTFDIKRIVQAIHKAGININCDNIYGVTQEMLPHIVSDPKWSPLISNLAGKLDELQTHIWDGIGYTKAVGHSPDQDVIGDLHLRRTVGGIATLQSRLHLHSPVRELVALTNTPVTKIKHEHLYKLLQLFPKWSRYSELEARVATAKTKYDEILRFYPMLKFISSMPTGILLHYCNLVDNEFFNSHEV